MVKRRKYRGIEDDQLVRDLLSRCYKVTGHPYFAVDPPNWERFSTVTKAGSSGREIQLWEVDQHPQKGIVGILEYHFKRCQFSYLVDPEYQQIAVEMLKWVEGVQRTTKAKENAKEGLGCSVCEKNKAQSTLLAQRGYQKGSIGTVFRKRILDGRYSDVNLPPGYQIREVSGLSVDQFMARAKAESELFGETVTVSFLRELQKAPIYRPELDLVITAPDGSPAAFTTIWFETGNRVGYFEPVATMPDRRRQGLGKVMLIEGFRRLQAVGAANAFLGHDANNVAANRLYESAGLSIFDEEFLWLMK